MSGIDVLLLQPPFAPLERPSMALSLLKPCLEKAGLSSRVLYPCLDFAREVGLDAYSVVHSIPMQALIGEWAFAAAAFPDFPFDEAGYYRLLPFPGLRPILEGLRAAAADFCRRQAERIVALQPRIVGASSVFAQHCASLALLRAVKALSPQVVTVMGGSNCEDSMGRVTHQAFPWVDFVVSGEAEVSFPQLCRNLLEAGPEQAELPPWVLGPAHRRGRPLPQARGQILDLNTTPVPDFDDYFEALSACGLGDRVRPCLIVETSRGCWWGAKHHCTFCGLNGSTMAFRSKSPERVLSELDQLAERYQMTYFEAVDNILDMSYLDSVFPHLRSAGKPYHFFYETKANLRYEQLRDMAAAGIRWLQPGIESLHDEILKLMDKGTTALQNVQLLKWARELGIYLTWNVLTGFPGERDEWYAETALWLDRISHLQPPARMVRMRYDRYSPYHSRPQDYGIAPRASTFYRFVYPLNAEQIEDLAYFFEDGPGPVRGAHGPGIQAVGLQIEAWASRFQQLPPILSLDDYGTHLELIDTRPGALDSRHRLEGPARILYLECDRARSVRNLAERCGLGTEALECLLADLDRRKLILRQNGRVLALATRGELPSLRELASWAGARVMADPRGLMERTALS